MRRWDLGRAKDKFRGRLVEGRVGAPSAVGQSPTARPRVAVLCPQTYMNDAGRSVGPARGSYKLALDRVLVVHDEIDLPFGELRLKWGGGEGGHNGLRSISRSTGSKDYGRVRCGVGRPPGRMDPADYVLKDFAAAERVEAEILVGEAVDAVRGVLTGDFLDIQRKINTKRDD